MLRVVVPFLALAACGGGGGFPVDAAPDSPPPGGRFSLAWTVTDADGDPIPCNQVGGTVVTITMRNLAQAGGFTEAFTCNGMTGTSSAIPPGVYEMSFTLTGMAGQLGVAPSQNNVMIEENQTTPLEPISFAVDATGALELRLNANQTGGNCGPVANMGAGIEQMSIVLRHTDQTCEPVLFQISGGGTYQVDCTTPVLIGCLESTQVLTASPLPSGNYRIQVRGKIGGADCWTNDDSLAVPPLGGTLDTTLNLVKAVGC